MFGTIRCRLDRALANEDWHAIFTHSIVEYLAMIALDHRPILATIDNKISRGRRQFRFDKRWIGMDGLMGAIVAGRGDTMGQPNRNVINKIIRCRCEILRWRQNNPLYKKERIT